MSSSANALGYAQVCWELIRYDILFACRGFHGVRKIGPMRISSLPTEREKTESALCEALAAVAPFYWKSLRCLQRSIVLARLLRMRGVPAQVVIGYRPAPFFSHAWVEVNGRVVSDCSAYQKNLLVLERL